MSFLVSPPEVNSASMFAGPGAGPLLAAAQAWEGVYSELSSAASVFGSVTSGLAAEAWRGPASALMTQAADPYVTWLGDAAVRAEESANQARAAAGAFEAARAAVVDPWFVAANRGALVSLVGSNLFGQNAPAIAAVEDAYQQMWAHDVAVMGGYHVSASAAVAQLGSWEQALEGLAGLPGQGAKAIASAEAVVLQGVSQPAGAVSSAVSGFIDRVGVFVFGTPPSAPVPATQNPTYGGAPVLANRIEVAGLGAFKAITTGVFGLDLTTQLAPIIVNNPVLAALASPFIGNTPPRLLTLLLGETVQQTTYDGMTVVQITPAHPSGQYVVAVHGGGLVIPPSIFHWLNYTVMANQTGATIEVPIYPLVQQGGTAGTVVPAIAGVISMEIAQHGASHVSVLGDSAGGTLALAAVEYMVQQGGSVPASMVLLSPWLDLGLTNPNIAFVHDPLLNAGPGQPVGKAWAGGLPLNNYLVSPLYGSLSGLPPTYVYSGSLDILGPDTLVLAQKAVTQGAPISFVLRNGEFHDWILLSPGGIGYLPQIYQELGI